MSKSKKTKKRPVEKTYPDTAQGAIAYLKAESSHNLDGAKCYADPQVDGVWKVVMPRDEESEFAIVYLKGYKNPWGNLRETNDFESCYRDESGIQDGEIDDEDDLESDGYPNLEDWV